MLDAIDYPKRHSEFEVQAYIYHTLRAQGFDVRGEVTTRHGSAILDLVVFDGRQPVLIIEVKPVQKRISARTRVLVSESTQEQLDSYRRLGISVQYVPGMSAAVQFCESFEMPVVSKG